MHKCIEPTVSHLHFLFPVFAWHKNPLHPLPCPYLGRFLVYTPLHLSRNLSLVSYFPFKIFIDFVYSPHPFKISSGNDFLGGGIGGRYRWDLDIFGNSVIGTLEVYMFLKYTVSSFLQNNYTIIHMLSKCYYENLIGHL